ncbi:hypothetical protein HNQ59_001122 [Chitinivorax tropicus]|uniref:Porin n=1 Tax=Chitinivorax tropicus TaxID=714531 RepID=A0A840MMB3_9PROT|nr:hypothetical protein [Chitinivorax tropicus]MBB5017852.1 hypothetical protein [Chitinivorax tropicus]
MKKRTTTLLMITLSSSTWAGEVDHDPGRFEWTLNGYYSISAIRTNREGEFYRYIPYGDQDRPAKQRAVDWGPDSKFGLMLGGRWSPEWAAKAQWLLRRGASKEPAIRTRLAFIEYKPRMDWSIKVGRTVQGLLMLEEAMFTDYANLMVRVPHEPYAYVPKSELDGLMLQHDVALGDALLKVQLTAGQSDYYSVNLKRTLRNCVGISLALNQGNATGRVALRTTKLGLYDPILADSTELIRVAARAEGNETLAGEYNEKSFRLDQLALGFEWLDSRWTIRSEIFAFHGDFRPLPKRSVSGSVMAGYRIGKWTPYVGYGEIREYGDKTDTGLRRATPLSQDAATVAELLARSIAGEQRTLSLGVRYDLPNQMAIKFQWDRLSRRGGEQGYLLTEPGALSVAPPDNNHTHIWTLSLQGVF